MVMPSWDEFSGPEQQSNLQTQEISTEVPIQEMPEAEIQDWGNFLSPATYQGPPDPTEEENTFGYILRNIIQTSSRLGEQLFGRYGNIEKMGKDILTNFPKTGGIVSWALSELLGQEKWETLVKGPKGQQQILPTSEMLKEVSIKGSKGYTKPKTHGEEKFQEFIEDVGSTISRRSIRQPTPRNIGINNILIPAAANVAKEIVEDNGFGKDKAKMAKMAVWLPFSLAANVNARTYAANLMNQGRQGYGANIVANVPRYQSSINLVSRKMLMGDPRSQLAQQQIAGINNDLATGQITMRDLMTRFDAINAAKRDKGLFLLNPGDRKAAIMNINQVRDAVRNEIEILGQINSQSLESWRSGVEAFAIIHRSNGISNFIEELIKGPYAKILTGPAAALFGIGSFTAIKAPIIAAPLSAITSASYKTGQTIYRMWKNEYLANYYWKAIAAAQKENIPAFINNYNKLNKRLEKSESPEKKSKSKKK